MMPAADFDAFHRFSRQQMFAFRAIHCIGISPPRFMLLVVSCCCPPYFSPFFRAASAYAAAMLFHIEQMPRGMSR